MILPIVVMTSWRPSGIYAELGYFARTALRHLDDLRLTYGRLDAPVPVNDVGGTVHVGSTTPISSSFRTASGWATTTPGSLPWR